MVDTLNVTTEDLQLANARRQVAAAEMKILAHLTDTLEATAQIYWPDGGVQVSGAVDKTVMDAIQDNLPFGAPQWPVCSTLDEVFAVQEMSRTLIAYNEFAKGAVKNRCNFVVGYGHTVSIVAKEGFEITTGEKAAALGVVREFIKRNKWRQRQRATQLRLDRDGEVFRRKFITPDGIVLRFVEPCDVAPPDEYKEADPFGIIFAPGDVETALGYWVNTGKGIEQIEGPSIQHLKLDDDMGCPRGVPLLMACRRSLAGASAIQRNTVALTKIQSHYALIRKHTNAVMASIQAAVEATSDVQVKNQVNGQVKYGKEHGPGGIHDVPDGVEYEFPSAASKPENFMPPMAGALRSAAASLVMPEYMFTADASNANYASTMVAEGPAVREFEAAQWDLIDADRELFEEELELAAARGVIPVELLERVEIRIEAPDPAVRNQKEQAEVRTMDLALGVSPQTLMTESGRDYETEMANTEAHIERTGGNPGAAFPLMANKPEPEPKQPPAV